MARTVGDKVLHKPHRRQAAALSLPTQGKDPPRPSACYIKPIIQVSLAFYTLYGPFVGVKGRGLGTARGKSRAGGTDDNEGAECVGQSFLEPRGIGTVLSVCGVACRAAQRSRGRGEGGESRVEEKCH
ncbi:hypothetical protein E2C01_090988 [Portunus trituberculatus]|uniref:Uncharacterized protein n=1 Tax=Portunus trituberculatus TaxID=210409 RepID=A0A5B7JI12_PORTR|nr:hypothetical protein [Portunus trituberculatus]